MKNINITYSEYIAENLDKNIKYYEHTNYYISYELFNLYMSKMKRLNKIARINRKKNKKIFSSIELEF